MSSSIRVSLLLSCFGLLACAKSSGNEDLDRCEAAARKIAEVFSAEDDERRSQRYVDALELCTLKPDRTLSAIGDAYLTCVDEAAHGAALLRCRYEMEAAAQADALAKLEAAALPLMKDLCAGKIEGELKDDPRFDEIEKLETEARELGVDGEAITAMMERVNGEAGCPQPGSGRGLPGRAQAGSSRR